MRGRVWKLVRNAAGDLELHLQRGSRTTVLTLDENLTVDIEWMRKANGEEIEYPSIPELWKELT